VRHFCHTRHTKIVYEACEQSRRLNIPTIHPPAPLVKLIQNPPEPFANSLGVLMLDAPAPFTAPFPSGMFIGPEGGWSPEEVTLFSGALNIKPAHLGSSVLRAETAAVVASTLMRYALAP
jgi:RsmE family RNA methyltransferase